MFKGKVVLITGASSGIGAQTALDFSKLGASLVLTGRNEDNLERVVEDCICVSPKKSVPLKIIGDMRKESDIELMVKKTIDEFGKIDILVNNAGVFLSGNIENASLDQYDLIMNTNVRGPYYLTMLVVPHLIETKGCIVNVSSVAGVRSFPNILAYSVSKASLDQFTRCTALELALKGVRVNAVNPGAIETGIHLKGAMTEEEYVAYQKKCKETHAIGRMGQANEVSAAITFLASDAASNITGVTLPVDGGRHAMCPR
ncbi:uncharacterized oxidoreductase TM_0325-like [Aricia agestis]|uniref:uncharacterized oxidoreductase TM_0325-like n=1 Tax=Aricia agestis TaxID=91739 RepID=UPI001C209078|nr:uncharacterized oxidoreductase TM_0325-like [Aricia agestis]